MTAGSMIDRTGSATLDNVFLKWLLNPINTSLMIEAIQETDNYISNFAKVEKSCASNEQAWLTELRRSALDSFQRLGFPTTDDEEWRFTSVAPITREPFKLATDTGAPSAAAPKKISFGAWSGIQLVFVNGIYSARLSSKTAQHNGVFAGGLSEAMEKHAYSTSDSLGTLCQFPRGSLSALNTAFASDGAFIFLPKECVVQQPIDLLFLSCGENSESSVCHPRVLVVAEENSQVQILESYASAKARRLFH